MNEKLQQAIVATRAGKKKEAQLLLTQVLKENPEEVQAWYLLSHLVSAEQKQIAYLKKVIALDPGHQKAKQRLLNLQLAPASTPSPTEPPAAEETKPSQTSPLPIAPEQMDLSEQAKADTIPDWMGAGASQEFMPAESEMGQEERRSDAAAIDMEPENLPDWLKEPTGETWVEEPDEEETKFHEDAPLARTKPEPVDEILPPIIEEQELQSAFQEEIAAETTETAAIPPPVVEAPTQPAAKSPPKPESKTKQPASKSNDDVQKQHARLTLIMRIMGFIALVTLLALLYMLFIS